jgi:hypothetical protein
MHHPFDRVRVKQGRIKSKVDGQLVAGGCNQNKGVVGGFNGLELTQP